MHLNIKSPVSGPRCLRAQNRFQQIGCTLDEANTLLSKFTGAGVGYTEFQLDDLLSQVERAPSKTELEVLVNEAIALLDANRAKAMKLAAERAAGKATETPAPGSNADVSRIEDVTLQHAIENAPGPNRVAKAMAYVASQHKGLSYDERHELACRLVRRAWGIR